MSKETVTIDREVYDKLLKQLRSCRNLMIYDLEDDEDHYDPKCGCDYCRVIKETTNLLKSLGSN